MGWCTSMKLNVIPIGVYAERIASELVTVTAKGKRVEKIAPASVCVSEDVAGYIKTGMKS